MRQTDIANRTGAGMVLKNEGMQGVAHFLRDQRGNSFFEHALLLSLMAVVCLIALLAICKGP